MPLSSPHSNDVACSSVALLSTKTTNTMTTTPSFITSLLSSSNFFKSSTSTFVPRQKLQELCKSHRSVTAACSPRASGFPSSSSSSKDEDRTLYDILGLPRDPDPRTLPLSALRAAYLTAAKLHHPDTTSNSSSEIFDEIADAWAVLSDKKLRRVYNDTGHAGLIAVRSISERRDQVRETYAGIPGDQLDMLSETGQLIGGLLTSSSMGSMFNEENDEDNQNENENENEKDACPRSIEEAIHNAEFHPDESVKYYTLWWIYRFKVTEAQPVLVKIISRPNFNSTRILRRTALALGAIAAFESSKTGAAVDALANLFAHTDDYFLRYRCAEALANIAYRYLNKNNNSTNNSKNNNANNDDRLVQIFDHHHHHELDKVINVLLDVLQKGSDRIQKRADTKNGYASQESLFNLDGIEDENTRARLREIFIRRAEQEERSRRTTMTPQLGVSRVGSASSADDEPYEWIIKAISAMLLISSSTITQKKTHDIQHVISSFITHEVPLVRYAARKALFSLTNDTRHAEAIVSALDYGMEHHYSQRVLIRDLGDVGYWRGAEAVAKSPMVENSFKILSLKNMLSNLNHDASKEEVRQVLRHMDQLL